MPQASEQSPSAFLTRRRSDEEAHKSPAESEVFHGNQLRNDEPAKEKHILQKILSIYPLLIFILLA
jgi:hypothetical protein